MKIKKLFVTMTSLLLVFAMPAMAQAEPGATPNPTSSTAPAVAPASVAPAVEPTESSAAAPQPKPTARVSSVPKSTVPLPSISASLNTSRVAPAARTLAPLTTSPSPSSSARVDHKPGQADVREKVPADLKLPNGQPHPCAGRNLIYRTHTDAVYATRKAGELKIMTVAGAGVIESDTICMRVGPDALRNGVEASRIVVPNDPNLTFLGKPGKILWTAPQENHGKHQPIWAGMGAFDESHEYIVPNRHEVPSGGLKINLVSLDGPGQMEVFGYNTGSRARRFYSSREKRLSETFELGAHSHLAWSFSAAGIYKSTWSATMETSHGTEQSKPQELYWLIGTDSDVSLPAGTTKAAETITKTAEQIRDELGLPKVDDDEVPEVKKTEDPPLLTQEEAGKQLENIYGTKYIPKDISRGGTYIYSQPLTETEPSPDHGQIEVDGRIVNPDDYQFAIEIPDSTMRKVSSKQVGSSINETTVGGWVWGLDNPGNTPGKFVLSTKGFDLTQKNDLPLRVSMDMSSAPNDSRVVIGQWQWDEKCRAVFKNLADSDDHLSAVKFNDNSDLPVSLMFTRPGVYSMNINMSWNRPDGSNYYISSPVAFYVGNAAINAGRVAAKVAGDPLPVLTAGQKPKSLAIPGNCATPTPTVTPTPTPTPTVTPSGQPTSGVPQIGLKQAKTGWAAKASGIKHVFTKGHLDLALRTDLTAAAHDTADYTNPRWLESGELAVAVPDAAYGSYPKGKGFVLPQIQVDNLPWVGFSTERVDYAKTGPVTVAIKSFSGPGQLLQAHTGLLNPFNLLLDSNQRFEVNYPERSHDHQMFVFTKPGLYSVEYQYRWGKESTNLRLTYLVGDGYVRTGLAALKLPIPSDLGANTPDDYPQGGTGLGESLPPPNPVPTIGPKPSAKPANPIPPSPAKPAPPTDNNPETSTAGQTSNNRESFGASLLAAILGGGPNNLGKGATTAADGDRNDFTIAPPAAPGNTSAPAPSDLTPVGPLTGQNRFYSGLALGVGSSALIAGIALLWRRNKP